MIFLLEILILLFAVLLPALLLIMVATLFVQIVAACLSRRALVVREGAVPPFVVVMPAHNEEKAIGAVLEKAMTRLPKTAQIVVVADNCSDSTADIARAAGVEVIERRDTTRIGKGHALAYGVRHVRRHHTVEHVVFFDADSYVVEGDFADLVATAVHHRAPVQACYTMYSSDGALASRLSELSVRLKNFVRPLGYLTLGMPSGVYGSGICMPLAVFDRLSLDTSSIVEDLWLGVELCALGLFPIYCLEVHIVSALPSTEMANSIQRRRWEAGTMATFVSNLFRLSDAFVCRPSLKLLAAWLDLFVLPLGLLAFLLALDLLLSGAIYLLVPGAGFPVLPVVVAGLLLAGLFLFWRTFGYDIISTSELVCSIPQFVQRKARLYASVLRGSHGAWVRTPRE